MKERLTTLMELEKLTPSRFADLIGVQRSSVSHLLAGRNKPSFDFLEKTLKAFPGLRAEWLMLGSGEMFGSGVRMNELFGAEPDSDISKKPDPANENERNPTIPQSEGGSASGELSMGNAVQAQDRNGPARRVVQVVVMYEDHTFETYRPSD